MVLTMVIFEPLLAILITMSLFSERDLRALLSLGVMLLVVGFGLSASLFRVCLVIVKYVWRSRFQFWVIPRPIFV